MGLRPYAISTSQQMKSEHLPAPPRKPDDSQRGRLLTDGPSPMATRRPKVRTVGLNYALLSEAQKLSPSRAHTGRALALPVPECSAIGLSSGDTHPAKNTGHTEPAPALRKETA